MNELEIQIEELSGTILDLEHEVEEKNKEIERLTDLISEAESDLKNILFTLTQ